MKINFFIICLLHVFTLLANGTPVVTKEVEFGNMKLVLSRNVMAEIQKQVNSLTSSPKYYQMKVDRMLLYFPVIERVFKEEGVPDDFKYLAVIESGLDNVTSPSGAKGFWQFMKSTGESHNLEINKYVDERYHLEKATQAACEYLQTAYNKFGSWTLAAASYNMGKTGLQNKLDQQKTTSYYDLLLNIETGRYVYRIVAAKYILSNSKNYGFNIRQEDLYELYQTKNIKVDSTINDLTDFAIQHNSNYKTIKLLNPWLRGKKLPNLNGSNYTLKLPIENSNLDPVSSSQK